MGSEGNGGGFSQPAIPKFDGDYDHWSMVMENLLRSKEYWTVVESGFSQPGPDEVLTATQEKTLEDMKLKDLKAKNYLFQSLDRTILKTITQKATSKQLWDSMKMKCQGNVRVQRAQLNRLRRDFEILAMKQGESIDDYFGRVMVVANDMRNFGEEMADVKIVEKILRTLTDKWNYIVCSIEEAKDIDALSVDALQSSLLVHEQKFKKEGDEEHALAVSTDEGYGGRGRGRGRNDAFRGGRGRGRGRQSYNKATVECYNCHQLGHYQYECPKSARQVNYAEVEETEEMLLMAYIESTEQSENHVWFLDSGCSNHMCGDSSLFSELEGGVMRTVRLGNHMQMNVVGKGSVRLSYQGVSHLIHDVFYVPDLKNNLLSIGQLQEKGLAVLLQSNQCKIYHPTKGLIIQCQMTSNRMFTLLSNKQPSKQEMCLKTYTHDLPQLWHRRYGHLSYTGLKTLKNKEMVRGLPSFVETDIVCTDCLKGKQHREVIPKKAMWRASERLELIHADICGPISPTSNGGKRDNGIKRQLTTAYTPQQNGVAERKNRTVMNMVRSLLVEKNVPKNFWPEAVNWAFYILNRSPTNSVKDMTPEEAWSGVKPSVEHLRVFGCVTHAHVPDARRTKLEDKSRSCVLFGISAESKGYRLYDPVSKKIVVSRDVVFEEDKQWNWDASYEQQIKLDLEWGDKKESEEELGEELTDVDVDTDADADANADGPSNVSPIVHHQPAISSDNPESSTATVRVRKAPAWMSDYVMRSEEEDEEEQDQSALFALFAGSDLLALFSGLDPVSFEDAVRSENWRQAMDSEISSIEKNGTWVLTDLPRGAKSIGVKWVYKTKLNQYGEVEKYNARLVAKGYTQEHGIDYEEVYAPVARMDTVRMILALAAQRGWIVYQLDMKSAFLQGELLEEVYVEQPRGYEVENAERKVYKLHKALYGLKQAPRAWFSRIDSYFKKMGFEKDASEQTLFTKVNKEGKYLIISLYVDDLIYTGNDEAMMKEFKESMMKEFDMSDLGKMNYFLGLEVIQFDGGIFISQKKYVKEVLKKFGMDECNSVLNVILFLYKKEGNKELVGFTDSDYAGCVEDRKSTSGYAFILSDAAVAWSSRKQPIVTLSRTEAEFVAAAACNCQMVWMKRILKRIGYEGSTSPVIFCDNSSTIKLSKNPIMHGKSKHIDVRFHFMRDLVNEGVVQLKFCGTQQQIADIFTKPLKLEMFQEFRKKLGVCDEVKLN